MEFSLVPLVSIVIPTYEQEELVLKAVQSALEQDHQRLEVIVVDDASPTARYERLRQMKDPRLRFVRNEHNLGRTRNYRRGALELARGDWIVNLDGDDFFTDRGYISAAIQRVHSDPQVVMVSARCVTRHRRGDTVSPSPGDVTLSGLDVVSALPREDLLLMHLATLYRRDLALKVDMYRRDVISSDWESLYRLAMHGRVAFMDRTVGVWCLHGANASGSSDWRTLADNLSIWPSVFAAARECGMDERTAQRACIRCLRHFGALQIPSVMRAGHRLDVLRYLKVLHGLSRAAFTGVLRSPSALLRLLAGGLGYYRSREF